MSQVTSIPKNKPMGLFTAIRHFFGHKPGQTLTQFRDEITALSEEDREYFRKHLIADGYDIKTSELPQQDAAPPVVEAVVETVVEEPMKIAA